MPTFIGFIISNIEKFLSLLAPLHVPGVHSFYHLQCITCTFSSSSNAPPSSITIVSERYKAVPTTQCPRPLGSSGD